MRRKRKKTGDGLSRATLALTALVIALPFLITSPAAVDYAAPQEIIAPEPESTPIIMITPAPTVRPTARITSVMATSAPAPTATPNNIVKLPMNDFSTGSKPLAEGFLSEKDYSDDSITVKITRKKLKKTVYTAAEVTISDPGQLRTALGGTLKRSATAKMSKIAKRSNAVVAINGDFYTHRSDSFLVRQSMVLHKNTKSSLDALLIDSEGDFHIFPAKTAQQDIAEFAGSVYQAFSFGPALIIDGEKQPTPRGYEFGLNYKNPRTAIGQLGPLRYLLLVADGRTERSVGVETGDLVDYMYDRGCVQAYNLDGGGSSAMYFGGKIINYMTDSGERSVPDIIYFASSARVESGAVK